MINLTHTQLELLTNFVKGIDSSRFNSYPRSHELVDMKDSLNAKLTRSKMVYSITLRYPITQIDDQDISWIIKNALPTKEYLAEFYESQGLV